MSAPRESAEQRFQRLERAVAGHQKQWVVLLTAVRHLCAPVTGEPEELPVGQIVVGTQGYNQGVARQIVAARRSGYDWQYLYGDGEVFASENSSDPHFFHGWVRLPTETLEVPDHIQ